jgi:nitrile hydratase
VKARPRTKKPATRKARIKKPQAKKLPAKKLPATKMPARRKPLAKTRPTPAKRRPVSVRAARPTDAPALPARFRPGARVRVIAIYPPGHIRTPHYIRGKSGAIERLCGAFGNPEELAFGRAGTPRQPLYRVRFAQREIWPDYQGPAADTVDIEIYQHWLEPA